ARDTVEFDGLRDGGAADPGAKLADESGLLRNIDESSGTDEPAAGVLPPHEGFNAVNSAGMEVKLGLILETELLVRERHSELSSNWISLMADSSGVAVERFHRFRPAAFASNAPAPAFRNSDSATGLMSAAALGAAPRSCVATPMLAEITMSKPSTVSGFAMRLRRSW